MIDTVAIVVGGAGFLLMLAATTSLSVGAWFFRALHRVVDSLREEVQALRIAFEGVKVTETRLESVEKASEDHEQRLRLLEKGE